MPYSFFGFGGFLITKKFSIHLFLFPAESFDSENRFINFDFQELVNSRFLNFCPVQSWDSLKNKSSLLLSCSVNQELWAAFSASLKKSSALRFSLLTSKDVPAYKEPT